MPRKVAPILDEILNAIDGILTSAAGKSLAGFERDWLLRHGVQRGIEIISEASRHLPSSMKALTPISVGRRLQASETYFVTNIIPFRTG